MIENENQISVNDSLDKDILLSELNNTYVAINTYITKQSKIINFTSAVFGALIALSFSGLGEDTSKVFLVLPYLLLTINSYLAYNLIRSYVVQGYRRYLELQLNRISKRHLIFYSKLVRENLLSKNPIAIMPIVINMLVMIFSIVECYQIASGLIQQVVCVWIPSIASLLILFVTVRKVYIYDETYSKSLEYSKFKGLHSY